MVELYCLLIAAWFTCYALIEICIFSERCVLGKSPDSIGMDEIIFKIACFIFSPLLVLICVPFTMCVYLPMYLRRK